MVNLYCLSSLRQWRSDGWGMGIDDIDVGNLRLTVPEAPWTNVHFLFVYLTDHSNDVPYNPQR